MRCSPRAGAGKTFTLSSLAPDNIGMMPRAAAAIFNEIKADPVHHYTVHMSYMQIYMEMIQVRSFLYTLILSCSVQFGWMLHSVNSEGVSSLASIALGLLCIHHANILQTLASHILQPRLKPRLLTLHCRTCCSQSRGTWRCGKALRRASMCRASRRCWSRAWRTASSCSSLASATGARPACRERMITTDVMAAMAATSMQQGHMQPVWYLRNPVMASISCELIERNLSDTFACTLALQLTQADSSAPALQELRLHEAECALQPLARAGAADGGQARRHLARQRHRR